MRSGASISLGLSGSSVNAGASSTWQTVSTPIRHWENTNGATTSSWRTNAIVHPAGDYRSNTFAMFNTAWVRVQGDTRTFDISASV